MIDFIRGFIAGILLIIIWVLVLIGAFIIHPIIGGITSCIALLSLLGD